MKIKSVTITDEQEQWLGAHKEINFSGLVQTLLDGKMKEK